MMKKILYCLLAIFALAPALNAQELEYSDEYLDTVNVKKTFMLNDYAMIGVQYGASYAKQMFSHKFSQESILLPGYCGVTFTKYGKMFGYLPYFGLQLGIMKGYEGYRFSPSKNTGYIHNIKGAEQVVYQIYEIPFLTQFHFDLEHFKLVANAGIYGTYRAGVERSVYSEGMPPISEDFAHTFDEYEFRYEYGMMGGAGFGLVFEPFEFIVSGLVRWSWGALYDSKYDEVNGSTAYPFDVIVTAGLHFHLSKRTGRDKASLKREAKAIVYGESK